MSLHSVATASSSLNLSNPGSFWKWSIFDISVANLVLIGVMVAIFGLALLIPFPDRHRTQPATQAGDPPEPHRTAASAPAGEATPAADDADADMWTARVRRLALRLLPPGK